MQTRLDLNQIRQFKVLNMKLKDGIGYLSFSIRQEQKQVCGTKIHKQFDVIDVERLNRCVYLVPFDTCSEPLV